MRPRSVIKAVKTNKEATAAFVTKDTGTNQTVNALVSNDTLLRLNLVPFSYHVPWQSPDYDLND